MLMRA